MQSLEQTRHVQAVAPATQNRVIHENSIENSKRKFSDGGKPSSPRSSVSDREYCAFDQENRAGGELSVIGVGIERCPEGNALERMTEDYFGIEFIASGNCCLETEGEHYELKAGAVYCCRPNQFYRIVNVDDCELLKIFVDLNGTNVSRLLDDAFSKTVAPRQVVQYRWIHDIFRQLQDSGSRGGSRSGLIASLLVELLVERIGQLGESTHTRIGMAESTYERCRAYLNCNFKRLRGISDWASECNVSSAYLARLFKRYASTTPSSVLAHCKMNHAAELLMHENKMVKDVANQVGFDDPYYFSRTFKQFFGVSPKQFAFDSSNR